MSLESVGPEGRSGWSRRNFLKIGAVGVAGMSLQEAAFAADAGNDVNVILLFLVGGPSQLETFDLKPNAPESVRGPFRPIRTRVPGIDICEHLPLTANIAQHVSIVRSVHHTAAPIHETGHQLMQTGSLFRDGRESPHYGAALSYLRGPSNEDVPPFVVIPGPIRYTGVCVSHGQTAGPLGDRFGPMWYRDERLPLRSHDNVENECSGEVHSSPTSRSYSSLTDAATRAAFDLRREDSTISDRYGSHSFGRSTLLARRLVEHGARCVTVNMFDTVFNRVTWDCHADGGSLGTTLDDYATTLCPMFDQAYSALIADLHERGMLSKTLVLACGEFGRTPVINPRGGRDHWTGAWSVLFAGGGTRGGQVIGATDSWAAEVKDRPVTPQNIAATVYRAAGIDSAKIAGACSVQAPFSHSDAMAELF